MSLATSRFKCRWQLTAVSPTRRGTLSRDARHAIASSTDSPITAANDGVFGKVNRQVGMRGGKTSVVNCEHVKCFESQANIQHRSIWLQTQSMPIWRLNFDEVALQTLSTRFDTKCRRTRSGQLWRTRAFKPHPHWMTSSFVKTEF